MAEAGCGYGTRGVAGWGAQCIISSGSGGNCVQGPAGGRRILKPPPGRNWLPRASASAAASMVY